MRSRLEVPFFSSITARHLFSRELASLPHTTFRTLFARRTYDKAKTTKTMQSTMMKTTKATSVLLFLLLGLQSVTAQEEFNPKSSDLPKQPPGLWGIDTESVEKWQSYLGEPDATGTFTLRYGISENQTPSKSRNGSSICKPLSGIRCSTTTRI